MEEVEEEEEEDEVRGRGGGGRWEREDGVFELDWREGVSVNGLEEELEEEEEEEEEDLNPKREGEECKGDLCI